MTTITTDVHADPRVRSERKWLLGRDATGARVWMFLRLEDTKGGTTIEHEEISSTLRYSFTFDKIEAGCRTVSSCGAGTEWSIRSVVHPAKGFTIVTLREIATFAERWHLNDMRAGCAHMSVRSGLYDDHKHETCSETGYRFGSAWLIEEVPTEDVLRIEQIVCDVEEDRKWGS